MQNLRDKKKKKKKKNYKNVINCNLKNNSPTQGVYRKRTIEIWEETAKFNTGCQRFADQAGMILKWDCFSNFEIMEIYKQASHEEYNQ